MRVRKRAVRRVLDRSLMASQAEGWGWQGLSANTRPLRQHQVGGSGVCKHSSTPGTEISYSFHVDGGT